MFERILLSPSHASEFKKFDIGALAECILFYDKAVVTQNFGGFIKLIKTIGIDDFIRLVEDEHIEFKFMRQQSAAECTGGVRNFRFLSLAVRDDLEYLETTLFRATERKGRSKRAANQLISKIEFINAEFSLSNQAKERVLDTEYLEACIPKMLSAYAPTYPLAKGCSFSVRQTQNGFMINSDINFNELNLKYKQFFPETLLNITEDYLLVQFQESLMNTYLACKYNSSIISSPVHQAILTSKIQSLAEAGGQKIDEAALFQSILLDSGRTVREVVNSGERTFEEVFELLPQARKFHTWAAKIGEDQNLIKEYFDSVNSVSWINSLPSKTIRLAVASVVGLSYPLSGLALSAADMFLIEKLKTGWKPSMFVEHLDCFTTPPQRF